MSKIISSIERIFKVKQAGSNIKQEIIGGFTTFVTMSYIIFIQPQILSYAGMDKNAVMVATCIASALACFLMGFLANYPIALAPGMGHNAYFAFVATPMIAKLLDSQSTIEPWQIALGAVFISGIIFILTSGMSLRETIIETIPPPLRHAIAVGIGLLITLIGFEWSGISIPHQATIIGLGNLHNPAVILSLIGLTITSILLIRKIKGAILIGILLTAIIGIPMGITKFHGIVSSVPSITPTFMKLKPASAINIGFIEIIFVFFFLDLFDTVGTLIGIGEKGNFIREGKLPRAREALLADAISTVTGAVLGTSTVTSYVESAAGVHSGAKTGLANIVTGILMLSAIFFQPLINMIAQGYNLPNGYTIYPTIAPTLIIVGCMMMSSVTKIEWDNYLSAIPAFLTITVMPFSGFRITEGIAFGLISYTILNIFSPERKNLHWLVYILSILFILRYIFLR